MIHKGKIELILKERHTEAVKVKISSTNGSVVLGNRQSFYYKTKEETIATKIKIYTYKLHSKTHLPHASITFKKS